MSDVERAAAKEVSSRFSISNASCNIQKKSVLEEFHLPATGTLNKSWRDSVNAEINLYQIRRKCDYECLVNSLDDCLKKIIDMDVRRSMKSLLLPLDGSVPQWDQSLFEQKETLEQWLGNPSEDDTIKMEIKHDVDQYNENREEWSRALAGAATTNEVFTELIESRSKEASLMKVMALFQALFCVGTGALSWYVYKHKDEVAKMELFKKDPRDQDALTPVAKIIGSLATICFAFVYGLIFFLVDAEKNLEKAVITISDTKPVVWENYNSVGLYFVAAGDFLAFAGTLAAAVHLYLGGSQHSVKNVYVWGSIAVAVIVHVGLVIRSWAVHIALTVFYMSSVVALGYVSSSKTHVYIENLKKKFDR